MITKSDFLLYLDAPRHLWAKKHQRLEEISPAAFSQHLMAQGQEVEIWGQRYIQEIVLPQYRNPGFELQRKFIDGHFEVIVDGLIYDSEAKVYDLYEIKSSTSVKKENFYDAAFQTLVCEANIPLRKIFIVHLNKDYIRNGEIDVSQLMVADDVTEKVDALKEEVRMLREQAWQDVSLDSYESVEDCLKPKVCPCKKLCHPNLPDNPIYNLPRLHKKKARQLKTQGIIAMKDIPAGFPLSDNQQLHLDVIKVGEDYLDSVAVKDELNKMKYPLYFLDYETYNPGIPMYDGYRPYQQIVFQFSLHIIRDNDQPLEHYECLVTDAKDPALKLVEELSKKIGDSGSVIVWNKAFEAGRNKEMAALYPEYAEFLGSINDRMFDLAVIFQKGYYVHPDFFGSYSIKKVLPVLAPEISYEGLPIPEGTQAMLAWAKIMEGEFSNDEIEQTKEDLLKYCKLDTFAMVRIWEVIEKISKN